MKKVVTCVVILLVVVCVECFVAWLVMLAWNWLMPQFGITTISFWMALVGMFLLSVLGSFFKK